MPTAASASSSLVTVSRPSESSTTASGVPVKRLLMNTFRVTHQPRHLRRLLCVVVRALKAQENIWLISHYPAVVGNLRDEKQLARPKLEDTSVLQRRRCRARHHQPDVSDRATLGTDGWANML
jgi:hypothetical protein